MTIELLLRAAQYLELLQNSASDGQFASHRNTLNYILLLMAELFYLLSARQPEGAKFIQGRLVEYPCGVQCNEHRGLKFIYVFTRT